MLNQKLKKHFPQIDGLRGVAILLILFHHCFGVYFEFFWIGVDLFFVLSGFLITRILLETRHEEKYFTNFYMRRTLRIFPLYYTVLILTFLVLPMFHIFDFDQAVYLQTHQPWFWLYMENWLFYREGWPSGVDVTISHFWSLAVEEQYYLVWPLLIFLFRENINAVIYLILALIATAVLTRTFGGLVNPAYYVGTHTRTDSLLVGSLISVLSLSNFNWLARHAKKILWITGAYVIAVLALTRDGHYSNPWFKDAGYTVLALCFASIIILSLAEGGFTYRLLNNRLLKFFGKYSYGIYVFHFPVFWIARTPFFEAFNRYLGFFPAKLATSGLCVLITLALSIISFTFLESPFLRLKKYF
jgi:peptidoglycan/LPS O-acetylase OafA/YrhL